MLLSDQFNEWASRRPAARTAELDSNQQQIVIGEQSLVRPVIPGRSIANQIVRGAHDPIWSQSLQSGWTEFVKPMVFARRAGSDSP